MTTTVPAERFSDVSAPAPDLDTLAITIGELEASVTAADSIDVCLAAVRAWDAIRREVQTYSSLVGLRFQQDTTDPDRKAEREAWDEAEPRWTELEVTMKRALLAHPRRAEIEAEIGAAGLRPVGVRRAGLRPGHQGRPRPGGEARRRVRRAAGLGRAGLRRRGPQPVVDPEVPPEPATGPSATPPSRSSGSGSAAHGAELDRIFDDLVRLRTAMAAQLGFDDFIGLGYRRMCRVDYDRADVERLAGRGAGARRALRRRDPPPPDRPRWASTS